MPLSKLSIATLSAAFCMSMALGEESFRFPPNSIIILDGKEVRTDDRGALIQDAKVPGESGTAAAISPAAPPAPSAEQIAAAKAAAEKSAREAREKSETVVAADARARNALRRLATSGWRDAQADLVEMGKNAVPLLIDAMSPAESGTPAGAFNLGGHTKADAGRASRQRTLADVCAETLCEIIANHTDYKGEIPAPNQHAWQDWWAAHAGQIKFGK